MDLEVGMFRAWFISWPKYSLIQLLSIAFPSPLLLNGVNPHPFNYNSFTSPFLFTNSPNIILLPSPNSPAHSPNWYPWYLYTFPLISPLKISLISYSSISTSFKPSLFIDINSISLILLLQSINKLSLSYYSTHIKCSIKMFLNFLFNYLLNLYIYFIILYFIFISIYYYFIIEID